MSPLFRPSLAAVALTAAAGAAAQSTQPWTLGKAIWEQPGACGACHDSGSPTLTNMRGRLTTANAVVTAASSAASRQSGMAAIWNPLTTLQRSQVASYVADIRAEGNALVTAGSGPAMSVAAIGQSSQITVTLFNNGRGPMTIDSNGITLTGANNTQFSVSGGAPLSCFNLSVAANSSCQVVVTFAPTGAAAGTRSATLTFAHNGEPLDTSSLQLTGTVGAAPPPPAPPPPPPPPPAASGGGGGGALSPAWLALLLPTALLGRRPLRLVRRATD